MEIVHFGDHAFEQDLTADVCIIGSGPVGLAAAKELEDANLSVLILESGGLKPSPDGDELNQTVSIGENRLSDSRATRCRAFGGTSEIWSGRCAPFDSIDFKRRDWVAHSGWPISEQDIAEVLEPASASLGLGPPVYDGTLWSRGMSLRWYDKRIAQGDAPPPPLDETLLIPKFWQLSKDLSGSDKYMRSADWFKKFSRGDTRVLLDATVTELRLAPQSRRVESAMVAHGNGKSIRVVARSFLLCGGGIENVRLLLASRRDRPQGLGNENDLVGRFFMDHPRAKYGEVDPSGAQPLLDRFCNRRLNHASGATFIVNGFALSEAAQARDRLLNCAGWVITEQAPDNPWSAIKHLRQGSGRVRDHLSAILRHTDIIANGAVRLASLRPVLHKLDRISLFADVEQTADPDSRITLSDRCDRFGEPFAKINWKIGLLEKRTLQALARASRSELGRLGLANLKLVDWIEEDRPQDAEFVDAGHPSGGTRMSESASTGVVDRNGQVHGIGALFIAGSSVFPTNSHANPTLMAVATAIRTARFMKRQLT